MDVIVHKICAYNIFGEDKYLHENKTEQQQLSLHRRLSLHVQQAVKSEQITPKIPRGFWPQNANVARPTPKTAGYF